MSKKSYYLSDAPLESIFVDVLTQKKYAKFRDCRIHRAWLTYGEAIDFYPEDVDRIFENLQHFFRGGHL